MKINIFGKEAEFDQLAIAVPNAERFLFIGEDWPRDICENISRIWNQSPERSTIELHYNYEQPRDKFDFKELELISVIKGSNWHMVCNRGISPLGLFAPEIWKKIPSSPCFLSHLGIHATEEEVKVWKEHLFPSFPIVQENWSVSHTNPFIAGKRWYHDVIFGTREALGFDMKITVRHDKPGAGYVGQIPS